MKTSFSTNNPYAEIFKFFGLIFLSIFVVYYTPYAFSQLYFLSILIVVYKTRNDFLLIAFFFVLLDGPGGLFSGNDLKELQRLPVYSFGSIKLLWSELFFMVYLLKVLLKKKGYRFLLKKDFSILGLYFIAVMLYSATIGMTFQNFSFALRFLIPWISIIIFPSFLNYENFEKLDRLLFPFVFIAIFAQIYNYVTGAPLLSIFKSSTTLDQIYLQRDYIFRVASNPYIILYSFHKALFYLFSKKSSFNLNYLYMVVVASFLSILLTATRGWILAFAIVLFFTTINYGFAKNIRKLVSIVTISIITFIVLLYSSQIVSTQITSSLERLSTINLLLGGDPTAGGTLLRLSKRGPRVLSKFEDHPILGWGFSETFFNYTDGHVGHHSMLLNVGYLGFIIFFLVFIRWIKLIFTIGRAKYVKNVFGSNLKIFAFGLIAIFIIHSTSHTFWGFYIVDTAPILLISLLLSSLSVTVYKAYDEIKSTSKIQ